MRNTVALLSAVLLLFLAPGVRAGGPPRLRVRDARVVDDQGRPVTLRVSVDNVADRRYWASAFDSFSAALLQGAPRTAKASASIDF